MMHPITLTLRNYRCFADNQPATIALRPGLTALIGKNNSGKSAILRMLYEFRGVWKTLLEPSSLAALLKGKPLAVQFAGVSDPIELFHNGNDRPLSVTLDLADPGCSIGCSSQTADEKQSKIDRLRVAA